MSNKKTKEHYASIADALSKRGKRITISDVKEVTGLNGHQSVMNVLYRLEENGLAYWEYAPDRGVESDKPRRVWYLGKPHKWAYKHNEAKHE